jgi:hypothetical protein
VTTPYVPFMPAPSQLRSLYRSKVQVLRLTPSLTAQGGMSVAWNPLSVVIDRTLDQPGYMWCRLDLGFIRPGKDFPAPLVAGRAPDRVGVCYYDPVTNTSGVPLVQANDRLVCVEGPIFGTFEVRLVPDVAQDYVGAHHIEVQVIEVSKQVQPGSPTPFPGGAP